MGGGGGGSKGKHPQMFDVILYSGNYTYSGKIHTFFKVTHTWSQVSHEGRASVGGYILKVIHT